MFHWVQCCGVERLGVKSVFDFFFFCYFILKGLFCYVMFWFIFSATFHCPNLLGFNCVLLASPEFYAHFFAFLRLHIDDTEHRSSFLVWWDHVCALLDVFACIAYMVLTRCTMCGFGSVKLLWCKIFVITGVYWWFFSRGTIGITEILILYHTYDCHCIDKP